MQNDASNLPQANASSSEAAGDTSKPDEPSGSNSGVLNDLRQAAHEFQDRNGQHHPIAEFLYQLTKMLTDDNSEIIEWADGRIRVHHPERLEAEVLHKYFRHSKFASFQRQLNYFGFRKIAGKGKMSPCSYVNDAATSDIRSLLLIKRKTNGSAARKAAMQSRTAAALGPALNPALAGMNLQALATGAPPLALLNGQALSSAMALLQENALRAGLGQMPLQQGASALGNAQLNLLALQTQQQLQQEVQNQQLQQQQAAANTYGRQQQSQSPAAPGPHPLLPAPTAAPTPSSHQQQGLASLQQLSGKNASQAPSSMEQLQAQIAALRQNGVNASALNASGLNLAASMPAMASLRLAAEAAQRSSSDAPASAALNPASAALSAQQQQQQQQNTSMPATAAMDAASATGQNTASLFDSAANLRSLLSEHTNNLANLDPNSRTTSATSNATNNGAMNTVASQVLLNRLPSSSTIFPENSVLNFQNMLGSSNRLSSLLSLNSLVREPSLVDLAAANRSQLAAAAAAAAANNNNGGNGSLDASKFRAPS